MIFRQYSTHNPNQMRAHLIWIMCALRYTKMNLLLCMCTAWPKTGTFFVRLNLYALTSSNLASFFKLISQSESGVHLQ